MKISMQLYTGQISTAVLTVQGDVSAKDVKVLTAGVVKNAAGKMRLILNFMGAKLPMDAIDALNKEIRSWQIKQLNVFIASATKQISTSEPLSNILAKLEKKGDELPKYLKLSSEVRQKKTRLGELEAQMEKIPDFEKFARQLKTQNWRLKFLNKAADTQIQAMTRAIQLFKGKSLETPEIQALLKKVTEGTVQLLSEKKILKPREVEK